MKSIYASEDARNEYRDLITDLASQYRNYIDIPDRIKHVLYDLRLVMDGPGDTICALTNHDDDRGEGGSAKWMFRKALEATTQPGQLLFTQYAERVVARLIMNLAAYYDEHIQADLEQERADMRADQSPLWDLANAVRRMYREKKELA